MSRGVDLKSISVGLGNVDNGRVSLIINLDIAADNEFEAINWLVSVLDEDA